MENKRIAVVGLACGLLSTVADPKTIIEVVEERNSTLYVKAHEHMDQELKTGQQSRRERRAKQRKNKFK